MFPVTLTLLPAIASAQPYLGKTSGILLSAQNIVQETLIPIAFTLSLLYFFWGVAKYIKSEGDGKEEGKKIMIWGIVALFVISSVWGLVYWLRAELGLGDTTSLPIPKITY